MIGNHTIASGALALILAGLALSTTASAAKVDGKPKSGALAALPTNHSYFQDAKGKPVVLIGDYTWGIFSDSNYDYLKFFDSLKSRGLNIARIWLWWGCEEFPAEDPSKFLGPALHVEPYLRPGPGTANDGRPRYDLTGFNPVFFDRLRDYCEAARKRNINLHLILMDAWMLKHAKLWNLHAYNRENNINGVDGDPRNTGKGRDGEQGICSLGNPKCMEFQKAYARKVVDTVNDFENIYFEMANENPHHDWDLALCDHIKEYEKSKPKQHLTMPRDLPDHGSVLGTWDTAIVHAKMLEKRSLGKPLIFDTDWTASGKDDEVRKAMWTGVISGGSFDYMDNSPEFRIDRPFEDKREILHRQINHMAAFVKKIKPWEMTPEDALVKSGTAYAMASSKELAAYLPAGGSVILDISKLNGKLKARWYNPLDGKFGASFNVPRESDFALTAPDSGDWALLIKSEGK